MKALVWHGKEDIRCDTVTDPKIYTAPWTVKGTEYLVPGAELGEEFCVPSDYAVFNTKVTGSAASGSR